VYLERKAADSSELWQRARLGNTIYPNSSEIPLSRAGCQDLAQNLEKRISVYLTITIFIVALAGIAPNLPAVSMPGWPGNQLLVNYWCLVRPDHIVILSQ
jgi:hypothetical protein